MAATLHVGLCDVTMHEAAHYFMKVMVNAGDGPAGSNPPTERKDKKPDRTEVFTRSNTPAFKTSDFELPVRVEGGTLRDDELELGAFAVIRTDPKDGDAAVNKATSKLVGVVRRRLADLAVALAAGPVSEPFVLLHPDGREVGQGTMVLRIELPPGAPALRATAEQRDGACYELVLRNGVNCSALAAAGSGGVVVVVSTQVRGMVGAELARSAPAVIGALTHWNQTLLLRPPAPLEASDAVVVALRPAAGGAAAAELARATLPLGLLRDEAPRDVRLLVAEPSGVALHLSLRRLPPAVATAAALELELRQLRPGAPGLSLGAPGLSLPPAGTVLVAVRYGSLAEYTPGALPWRHTPAAAAGADALARALGAPPPLADARTVTWAREGGEWPAAFRWALESRTATPSAGAGVALELYAPEATTAGGAGGAGGGCEWRLWAHATLPVPAELREARVSASAAFEVPLVLARAVAALPGASPAPLLAGSLRWLAPTDAAQPRASAPAPRADASAPPSAALVSATGGGGGGNAHVASGASGGGAPAAALLAELEQKQALINRLLRDVDARTAALARCGHELVTLRDRHAGLEAAHTRAARELAEKDKVLDRLAHDAAQSEHIDPIELARRHRLLGGAYRTEKTRSDELARQLTVLSERVGTAGRLETAYVSLQDAHRAQASELQRAQAEAASLPKYKATVRAQEKVILKLESLVRPAIRDARNAKGAAKENEAMKARLETLEAQHDEAAGVDTEEQVRLLMRAEQAEMRAAATEAEMAETAKKYAREITGLKVRLAEKDAELLGGFGGFERGGFGDEPRADAPDYSPPSESREAGAGGAGTGTSLPHLHLESLVPRTPPSARAEGDYY